MSTIGVSIVPSSSTCVEPASLPKALPTNTAPATLSWNRLPPCGRTAVTPVRTPSPSRSVTWPTLHAGDVGDGVERPRREDAGRQPQVAGPRPVGGRLGASRARPGCRSPPPPPAVCASSTASGRILAPPRRSPPRPGPRDTIHAVTMRHIPLAAVEEAASAVYAAAVRTPLVRLDLPFPVDARPRAPRCTSSSSASSRSAPSSCAAPTTPSGSCRAGRAGRRGVDGERRQRRPGRGLRRQGRRRAVLGDGDGHRARDQGAGHRAARRHDRPRLATTSAGGRWKPTAPTACSGHFVHPFDDDTFIAGNATAGLEILEDLPDVDAVVARDRRRRPAGRPRRGDDRTPPVGPALRRRAGNRLAAGDVAGGRGAAALRRLAGVVRGRRRRQVGAAVDVAAAAAARRPSIVVTLDEAAAAMKLVAERVHVVIEGAAACAVAAALSGRAGTGRIVGDRLGRQHRSRPLRHPGRRLPVVERRA